VGSRCRWLALVLLLPTWPAAAEHRLHLKSRQVEVAEDLADHLAAPPKRRAGSRSHLLLQFRQPPEPAQLEELQRRGLTALRYVPDAGLLVSAPDQPSLEGLNLRFAGRLRSFDKLSPLLAEAGAPSAFVVEFHPDVDPAEAQALVREHLLAARPHPDLLPHHLLVEGSLERLLRLAEWEEVAYIYPASSELTNFLS